MYVRTELNARQSHILTRSPPSVFRGLDRVSSRATASRASRYSMRLTCIRWNIRKRVLLIIIRTETGFKTYGKPHSYNQHSYIWPQFELHNYKNTYVRIHTSIRIYVNKYADTWGLCSRKAWARRGSFRRERPLIPWHVCISVYTHMYTCIYICTPRYRNRNNREIRRIDESKQSVIWLYAIHRPICAVMAHICMHIYMHSHRWQVGHCRLTSHSFATRSRSTRATAARPPALLLHLPSAWPSLLW